MSDIPAELMRPVNGRVVGRTAHFHGPTCVDHSPWSTWKGVAEQVTTDRHASSRSHTRHGAALALRIAAAAIPVIVSIVAACIITRWVGPQELGLFGWVLPGIVALVVVFLTERVCRRVLPLASLLKLTMAFPDQAPSRLSIALRTGTVRQLRKWTDELETNQTDLTAAEAADAC